MNFDPLAKVYRLLETVFLGRSLWRCRTALQGEWGNKKYALCIGDGDGQFTAELLRVYPKLSVTYLDASRGMMLAAQERVRKLGCGFERARFLHLDIRSADLDRVLSNPPDLVVTHFLFDCLTQAESDALAISIRKLAGQKQVHWLTGEFAIPTYQPARFFGRMLVSGLYIGARLITGLQVNRIPNYAASLTAAGFTQTQVKSNLFSFLRAELWVSKDSKP